MLSVFLCFMLLTWHDACISSRPSSKIIIRKFCLRCSLIEWGHSSSCAPLQAGDFLRCHIGDLKGPKRCDSRQYFPPTLVKQIFPEFPILSTRRTRRRRQGWSGVAPPDHLRYTGHREPFLGSASPSHPPCPSPPLKG